MRSKYAELLNRLDAMQQAPYYATARETLADWYLCETCGDLADSLSELGFCYDIGENIAKQIAEYRREEAAHREYMKTHNAALRGGEAVPLESTVMQQEAAK